MAGAPACCRRRGTSARGSRRDRSTGYPRAVTDTPSPASHGPDAAGARASGRGGQRRLLDQADVLEHGGDPDVLLLQESAERLAGEIRVVPALLLERLLPGLRGVHL